MLSPLVLLPILLLLPEGLLNLPIFAGGAGFIMGITGGAILGLLYRRNYLKMLDILGRRDSYLEQLTKRPV